MDWSKIQRKRVESARSCGVYADLEDLIRIKFQARDFSFHPRQPVTSVLSGRYGSRLRGRGLNFEELRPYHPGDDIRTMDWKVTARMRAPYVRAYSEEKDRQVMLVVDQRINMFFGTRQRLKSVTAAELAALGAWRALDAGDRVGAVIFNDENVEMIRPQRSQATVMRILRSVVDMNHALHANSPVEPNPGMLNAALRRAVQFCPHDVLAVLISDADGVDEETERLTATLAARNDVIAFLVVDDARANLGSERITISDGRLQLELNLGDRKLRERIIQDVRTETEAWEEFLRRLSSPLLRVSNGKSTVGQVRQLLGVSGSGG